MSAAAQELIVDAARAHAQAGRGARTEIVRQLAQQLGVSMATAYQRLQGALVGGRRQRRSDAGCTTLTRDEALLIAATIEETRRLTGTGALSLDDAVSILRRNGKVRAGREDPETGEFVPLSCSAILRALRQYHCHPGQLAQPTGAVSQASEHPNHYWQIDASVSRQFYLADSGTQQMPRAVFYRGKPANFDKIKDRRLLRYDIVDHCSGHLRVFYVQRAESALNVIAALIHAMTPAPGIAMHGAPRMIGFDKGTQSAAVEAFCDGLGIEPYAHAAGNPRAIGSGERGQGLIETTFEACLKLADPVVSIEEINRLAATWCAHYNATRIHTRHGMTRRDAWLRITPAQLRTTPAPDVLRELATTSPTECRVRDLAIRYRGSRWDLRDMPGVCNGQRVRVVHNVFDPDTVRVLTTGQDGRPAHYLAPRRETDGWGWAADAARVGQEFKTMPDTAVDAVRKEMERLAMQCSTDAEAAAARKAKRRAFGGEIDPTLPWRAAPPPAHVPRAGTPLEVVASTRIEPTAPPEQPRYEPRRSSPLETIRELKRRMELRGGTWTPEHYATAQQRWPDGLTEDELDSAVVALMAPALRAIAGGAA